MDGKCVIANFVKAFTVVDELFIDIKFALKRQ